MHNCNLRNLFFYHGNRLLIFTESIVLYSVYIDTSSFASLHGEQQYNHVTQHKFIITIINSCCVHKHKRTVYFLSIVINSITKNNCRKNQQIVLKQVIVAFCTTSVKPSLDQLLKICTCPPPPHKFHYNTLCFTLYMQNKLLTITSYIVTQFIM